MTTTEEVPMPFSPYLVSEWTGPEMVDRRTWTAYTADQLRAYADARCAKLQAERDEASRCADEYRETLESVTTQRDCLRDANDAKAIDIRERDRSIAGWAERARKAEAERDALAEKVKELQDELDHTKRVLAKTCQWPDCNCPQSMGTGHLHCERQPIHVIEPSKQAAAIDAAGGDQC